MTITITHILLQFLWVRLRKEYNHIATAIEDKLQKKLTKITNTQSQRNLKFEICNNNFKIKRGLKRSKQTCENTKQNCKIIKIRIIIIYSFVDYYQNYSHLHIFTYYSTIFSNNYRLFTRSNENMLVCIKFF